MLNAAYVQFLALMSRCTQSPGTSAHAVPHSEARQGLPEGPGSTETPLSDFDDTLDHFFDLLSTYEHSSSMNRFISGLIYFSYLC